jgi:chloramphenicol 3-O-phosphotransferase
MQNELFKNILGGITNKFIIGIECDLEELKTRELKREDRRIGLAEKQSKGVHSFLKYDLVVDSGEDSTD